MATTSHVYGSATRSLANKEIDFDSDTLKVMLCTSSYGPDVSHRYRSDVTGEATGAGYTAGGAALTGVTVVYSNGTLTLDCNDVSWSPSTITARYAVFYDAALGSANTQPLICYWDFGANQSSSNGPFTLTIASGGLVTLTAS